MSTVPVRPAEPQQPTLSELRILFERFTAQCLEVEASGVALAELLCNSPSADARAAAQAWLSSAKRGP